MIVRSQQEANVHLSNVTMECIHMIRSKMIFSFPFFGLPLCLDVIEILNALEL